MLMRFFTLPPHRRALSIEAVITLGLARLLVLIVPIRWITRMLERQTFLAHAPPPDAEDVVCDVAWAVRAAAPKTPWESACLAQALAGKWMLGRRGVESAIRLGVARNADGKLQAHAWLCVGDAILTGGTEVGRFELLGDLG